MNLVSGRWQTFWTKRISYLSKTLSVLPNIYPCTALLTPNSNIVFGLACLCVSVSFAQLECDGDKILVEMWVFTNLFQPQKDNLTWSIFKMQLILTLSPIFLNYFLLFYYDFIITTPLYPSLSLCLSLALSRCPCHLTRRQWQWGLVSLDMEKGSAIDWHDELLFPCSFPTIPIIPLS